MEKESSKPFYLHPPWDILFNLERLRKINPWNIDIAFLLSSFLEEMERRASVDFRASGIALDSSASIYLMKSSLLLKLEEPPEVEQKQGAIDFVPPPLVLPLRYELTTTTIQHLLEALDEALKSENILSIRAPSKPILPPPEIIPNISIYLMEIEEEMERLNNKMLILSRKGEILSFSKLTEGLGKIEMIKVFLILLFMAHKGRITLWQQEDLGEIYITLNGAVNVEGGG
jgi:chromatin segregation and condensation protein Rec8/ScpA/Scc1 (kleisin family)